MTPDEERAALAEVCALAKAKGLTVAWQNADIVVIHASVKTLKNGQVQIQSNQEKCDQPIHG